MADRQTHYFAEGLVTEERVPAKGKGIYAVKAFKKGDLLCCWGGDILNREQLEKCTPVQQIHAVQVEEGLYIVPHRDPEPADYANHSCEPNAGLQGQIALCAMRDIEPGEEICFDYATTDSSDYDEFQCACGTPSCRGTVRGDDWRRPDVQAKYKGWFSPYLQRRIDRLAK
ncbi:MAG: SET domain-containing protein [Myxococcota bacterium]